MRPKRRLLAVLALLALAAGGLRLFAEPRSAQVDRARSVLQDALAADADNIQLWLHLGFLEHKNGNVDAAQAAFEKAAALDASETSAQYMLGLIYEKKGLKAQAIAAWKACQAHSKDPNILDISAKHLKELEAP